MPMPDRPFLTAEWRFLAMLQWEVEPDVLRPFVPRGTELDDWRGRTLVSLVGFRFLQTRVMGASIPFHRSFDEVNLRLYVRRRSPEGWRRAVVFIREIVPRPAIAAVARLWYNEPYIALPMRHVIDMNGAAEGGTGRVRYEWRHRGRLLCSYVPLFPGYVFLRADSQAVFKTLETNLVARVLAVPDQSRARRD